MTCLGYDEVFQNNLPSVISGKTAITILLLLPYNLKGRACLKGFFYSCLEGIHSKNWQTFKSVLGMFSSL